MEENKTTLEPAATAAQINPSALPRINDDEEIDLTEVFFTLVAGWKLILICLLIGAAVTGLFHAFVIKPSYQAYTELYITSTDSVISLQDLQLGSALTADYSAIIKSRNVLNQVIDDMGLEMDYGQLKNMVTVTNPNQTHIIHTEVTTGDVALSRDIANTLLKVSLDEIYEIVGTSQPSIIDYAEAEAVREVTPSLKRYLAIGGLIGAALACAYLIIRMLMDTTIHSEDDIEKYLHLPVLAAVPFFGEKE